MYKDLNEIRLFNLYAIIKFSRSYINVTLINIGCEKAVRDINKQSHLLEYPHKKCRGSL